ncbi:MAG TPA: cobalt ECF transporter S component CbiM [Methanobacteriaceae archaeon]|nr:cobalt ECF transporter S component CbiM [Methanobacteriaceae archaeon]
MHIGDGFLTWQWCLFWYLVTLPVVAYGVIQIKKITDENPESKPLLAVAGAFMFVLSSLKLPSVTGSSSHATGGGLGAVLFGPAVVSVLATITLLFQALLLAHGGISTLGANIFSMGILGPLVTWIIYKSCKKAGISMSIAVFMAVTLGDLMTYVTTAIQLSLAFPIPTFSESLIKFLIIFAYTQLPLAIVEGLITVIIFDYIKKLRPDVLERLGVLSSPTVTGGK